MKADARLKQIEDQLGIGSRTRPFILAVAAGRHKGDPEYEARLQRRIEETQRRYPNDGFRLILA